jgi:hypothetical protein
MIEATLRGAMVASLGIIRAGERSADEIARHSRLSLDRPLGHAGELWVAVATDEAVLLGAFQRGAGMGAGVPLMRRGSGGPDVFVGGGTVHVALALAHPGALTSCDERRIVNRSVRPLLRALARTGSLAHFFGRDWVSVEHRPAAWVGFAHDSTTRRTLFEAFVSVRVPFTNGERASFLGKAPGSLESIAGRPVDSFQIAEAVVDAYRTAYDAEAASLPVPALGARGSEASSQADLRGDPPWVATCEEAIGTLGVGPDARGVLRIGGDLLVSRDALARLESRLARGDDPGHAVDETLAAPGVALDGVRSLKSVRDLIDRARG